MATVVISLAKDKEMSLCWCFKKKKKKGKEIIILFVMRQQRAFQIPSGQMCCKQTPPRKQWAIHFLLSPWSNSRNVTFFQREIKHNQYRWHFPQGSSPFFFSCLLHCLQCHFALQKWPSSEPIPYKDPCPAPNPLSSPIQKGSCTQSMSLKAILGNGSI